MLPSGRSECAVFSAVSCAVCRLRDRATHGTHWKPPSDRATGEGVRGGLCEAMLSDSSSSTQAAASSSSPPSSPSLVLLSTAAAFEHPPPRTQHCDGGSAPLHCVVRVLLCPPPSPYPSPIQAEHTLHLAHARASSSLQYFFHRLRNAGSAPLRRVTKDARSRPGMSRRRHCTLHRVPLDVALHNGHCSPAVRRRSSFANRTASRSTGPGGL